MSPANMAALHALAFARSPARPWSEAEFRDLLGTTGTYAVGHAEAFAVARVIADEAELLTIATHPSRRRMGLARSMMTVWQREAIARGATRAFLEVAADNLAALRLYHACGYTEVGRRKNYYQRPGATSADALTMSRDLSN
nr:GNAT family N-acetyltransferase [Marinibacterium profundimaris]